MKKLQIEKYLSFFALAVSFIGFIIIMLKSEIDISSYKVFIGTIGGLLGATLSYFFFKAIEQKPKSTVFIAHTYQDRDTAKRLSKTLESKRIKVIDEDEISEVGENIIHNYKRAIKSSDYIIFIISSDSKNDKLLNKLITQSKSFSKKIIPLLIDREDDIPSIIYNYKPIYTNEDFEKVTNDLAEKLVHV